MHKGTGEFCYFKSSIHFLCTNQLIISLLLIIEYLDIFAFLISPFSKFKYSRDIPYDNSISFTFYLSIYNLFKKYLFQHVSLYSNTILIILSFLIVWYHVHIFFIKNISLNNKFSKTVCIFHVNFYNLFVFRTLFLYLIDADITFIIGGVYYSSIISEQNNPLLYIELILGVFMLVIMIITAFIHIKNHCVFINYNMFLNEKNKSEYPFDIHATYLFDIMVLIMKLFISIEKNSLIFSGTFINDCVILFNVLGLILFIMYFIYLCYTLLINKVAILFYRNLNTTKLRFALSNVTLLCILIHFFLEESFLYILILLDFICCLLFIVFSFHMFEKVLFWRFYNCNDLIAVLYFIINFNSTKINIDQCIQNWYISHIIKCNQPQCTICQMIDIKHEKDKMHLFKYDKLFHFIYKCIKIDMGKHKEQYTKKIGMYIDIFELVDLYLTGNNQKINFYICANTKIRKYKNDCQVIHFNFALLFDEINELNSEFIKSYNNFNTSEEIFKIYSKFLSDVENFIRYDNKTFENIMTFSNNLYMFAHNKKILSVFNKSTNNYTYELIILKYLFESLTHKILKKQSLDFDINQFNNLLSFHWKNDKFMLINYNIVTNDCTIIRSNNKINKTNEVLFETIFPKYLRSNGKDILINELKTNNFDDNNNNFEFIINNQSEKQNEDFVESFKMKFIMYPSLNIDEILIKGIYNYQYIDVLLFEIIDNEEILISFSENFLFAFNMNPLIIKELLLNKKRFEFKHILNKKESSRNLIEKSRTKNIQITSSKIQSITKALQKIQSPNSMYYSFNYEKYLYLLESYLYEMSNYEQIKNQILLSLNENKQIIDNKKFKISKIIPIKTNITKFNVYFISIEKNIQTEEGIKSTIPLKKDKILKNKTNFLSQTEIESQADYFTQTVDNSLDSSSNAFEPTLNTFSTTSTEKEKKKEKKKRNIKNINSFIFTLISIHTFTMIIGISYLIFEILQVNAFEVLFYLFQNFNFFKRGIDIDLLRIYSNLCFFPSIDADMINDKTCINYFSEYSEMLIRQNQFMQNDIPINEIVNLEFKTSLLDIKHKYISFLKGLYSLSSKQIQQIENKEIDILVLRFSKENKRIIIIQKEPFLNSINMYFNYFVELLAKDSFISTPMKFITLNFDNKSHQFEIQYTNLLNITDEQKLLYTMILNFPFITKLLLNIQNDIKGWFSIYLRKLKIFSIVFIVSMIIFNIILLISKILFVIYFINHLNLQIQKIHKLLFSPMFINFYLKRNALEQTILYLYKENPIELIKKINLENDLYKKQLDNIKKSKIKLSKTMRKKITKSYKKYSQINKYINQDSSKKNVFNCYIIFVAVTYVILISILLIVFTIMNTNMEKLYDLVDYIILNSEIDNHLNTNLNGIQFMILTNTTDNQIGGFIYNNFSYHFVSESIENQLLSIKGTESFKSKYINFFTSEISKDNRTCDELPAFNDTEFSNIIEEGKENFFNKCLINLCKVFAIMTKNSPILLMENIIYFEEKILNNIMLVNYDLKLHALQVPELYQLYGLILILCRIQRNYINKETLPQIVRTIISEYKEIITMCLLVIVFLLIFVAFFTITFVTNQLTTINNKLNLLRDFFK